MINAVYPIEPEKRKAASAATTWRFVDGQGRIGFVSPVTAPFCADCDRLRITADGMLRTCLFSLQETDLKQPLRTGASDAEIEATIRAAVWRKELKHRITDRGFQQPARTMSRIGC